MIYFAFLNIEPYGSLSCVDRVLRIVPKVPEAEPTDKQTRI